ncbi:MAG: hypothetical protein ACI9KN_001360 [Gammaproteobacteria bacterium]|jgi:hypothetical protein
MTLEQNIRDLVLPEVAFIARDIIVDGIFLPLSGRFKHPDAKLIATCLGSN